MWVKGRWEEEEEEEEEEQRDLVVFFFLLPQAGSFPSLQPPPPGHFSFHFPLAGGHCPRAHSLSLIEGWGTWRTKRQSDTRAYDSTRICDTYRPLKPTKEDTKVKVSTSWRYGK